MARNTASSARNNVVDLRKENKALFRTRIDLPEDSRQKLVALLNSRLADTLDVNTQTKFAHWNVKGNDFYQLHLLFDQIAEHLEDQVDLIAERITALGGRAHGTLRQAAQASSIEEYDTEVVKGLDHVRTLSDRVATLANSIRESIDSADELGDAGTSDLLTQIVRDLDKDLYFLESHIQI
jgi:starvation-inducible DNA-binding protein